MESCKTGVDANEALQFGRTDTRSWERG
jgi:hypothetical protein